MNTLSCLLIIYMTTLFQASCSSLLVQEYDYCGPIENHLQHIQPKTVKLKGCRKTYPMANFDPLKISGKWYAYQMYNFGTDMDGLQCSADYFYPTPYSLNYKGVFIYKNGTVVSLLDMEFPLSQFVSGQVKIPGFHFIRVVDTDYANYILWHACLDDPKTGLEYERIDLATRRYGYVSPLAQSNFNKLIDAKIFGYSKSFPILPFGRCNCLLV